MRKKKKLKTLLRIGWMEAMKGQNDMKTVTDVYRTEG